MILLNLIKLSPSIICRYISHFMTNVPFPTPQRPRVQVLVMEIFDFSPLISFSTCLFHDFMAMLRRTAEFVTPPLFMVDRSRGSFHQIFRYRMGADWPSSLYSFCDGDWNYAWSSEARTPNWRLSEAWPRNHLAVLWKGRDIALRTPCLNMACVVGLDELQMARNPSSPPDMNWSKIDSLFRVWARPCPSSRILALYPVDRSSIPGQVIVKNGTPFLPA